MKTRPALALAAVLATTTSVAAASTASDPESRRAGFDTTAEAQLVPLRPGVEIDPLLTAGDTIGRYQMSGIPDGLGAYIEERRGEERPKLTVLMNHELSGAAPEGVGARISRLKVDPRSRSVLNGSYLVDGTEGYLRFCSATLARIGGRALFFTGEESTDTGARTPDPDDGIGRGGTSITLDPVLGLRRQADHLGLMPHENVVPVKGLDRAFMLTTEDGDPGENESQLYAYIAPSFRDAIRDSRGRLSVWKANGGLDGDPSTNDIAEGETLRGRFVPIPQSSNSSAEELEAAAQAAGAFDFVRLEDAAVAPEEKGQLYITDTGSLEAETTRGRLYGFDVSRKDPTRAALTLMLDGDRQAAEGERVQLVNPDNLDASERVLVIQEDRNSEHRDAEVQGGYGRVLVYGLRSERLRPVARVATPDDLRPGEWESSGVIDAQALLGDDMWLLDVQAHKATAPQPGPSLQPDSSTGEAGQLLAIKIPRT